MAEELKHLLERIQSEGVAEADKKAAEIKSKAQAEADKIVSDARVKAAAMIEDARKEADAQALRGRQALEQAARDVVLTVGEGVSRLFDGIVKRNVDQALDAAALQSLVVSVVDAYAKGNGGEKLQVIVAQSQQNALADTLIKQLGESVRSGVTISGDDRILSGFRVAAPDAHVEHDFTGAAVSDALCELLRPHLAEIVRSALPAEK